MGPIFFHVVRTIYFNSHTNIRCFSVVLWWYSYNVVFNVSDLNKLGSMFWNISSPVEYLAMWVIAFLLGGKRSHTQPQAP